MSGNQKSHWAISPATYTVRPAGSGGRYAGRNSATRPLNVRIPYGQPTRSAITVAGIVGTALNNSRIRGSNPSTRDPAGVRSYLGGPSLANAAFTVFREQPTTRAISEIETPSERRSLRISAQSSTISTRSLPRSTPARVSGKLVKFQLPHRGQFSAAADKCPLSTELPAEDASGSRHSLEPAEMGQPALELPERRQLPDF